MQFLSNKINTRKHKWSKRSILAGILMLFATSTTSVFLFHIVFAAPTEPVPAVNSSSQNTDFTTGEAGSWKVNKMAGWTARNKARIVIDVDTKLHYMDKKTDILLVVDRSANTDAEEKREVYRNELTAFINKILDEDNDRRVALVTFDYDYSIRTSFTNDRDGILLSIDGFSFNSFGNNYYQALNGAERVLRSYNKQPDRDVIVLFLTDSTPNEEDYFQKSEFRFIKAVYPYVTINAVQYEMGDEISESLMTISDNQFSANASNLRDVLFDASVIPYYYNEFNLTDYIDGQYFTLSETNPVLVNKGSYSIENADGAPKIVWNLSDVFRSGSSANMEINLDLRPEYHTEPVLFPTNKKTTITSSIPELQDENVTIDSTPVLKADYKVRYIVNAPSDCNLADAPTERTQFIFDVVDISETTLSCPGYRFAGFKSLDRLKKVNDDYFIMPSNDVTFIATWGKVSIGKTMDGTISTVRRLYDEIDKKARKDDGTYNLDSSILHTSHSNYYNANGTYTVASTSNDEYPRHYFRGAVSDNNVMFAGLCWKAALTTSTGGVKLVYNGEVGANGSCDNLRGNHDGYNGTTSSYFGSNYYYGTDYNYDKSTGRFSLAGVKTLARMSDAGDALIGQYTCKSADPNGSCSTLYLIDARDGTSSAYVITIETDMPYYTIGKVPYNRASRSAGYVGYMYGDAIENNNFKYYDGTSSSQQTIISNTSISTDFWYADEIFYDETGDRKYHLVNPYQIDSEASYSDLVGKYTFRNSSVNYSTNSVYYIAYINKPYMYYLHLSQGDQVENVNVSYNISDEVVDNGDGTYTMVDPTIIKTSEWPARSNEFTHKFICAYDDDNSCSEPKFIISTSLNYYYYVGDGQLTIAKARDGYNLQDYITVKRYQISQNPSNFTDYIYSCGNTDTVCTPENLSQMTGYNENGYTYNRNILLSEDAVWDGTNYILSGSTTIENLNNLDVIPTHHYFCETPGQTTCSRVKYIVLTHSYSNVTRIDLDSITLENGETPSQVLERTMENRYDSTVKSAIDNWYSRTLIDYTNLIEDAVYCNDRTIDDYAGWNPHGGDTRRYLRFNSYYRAYYYGDYGVQFDCPAKDSFTVNSSNGNGALTYPVGILSIDEANLIGAGRDGAGGENHYLNEGNDAIYLSMTPLSHDAGLAYMIVYGGGFGMYYVSSVEYVRPVISVMPGIVITTGDGTAENPWVIE